MQFRLLGPIEAVAGGFPVSLPPRPQSRAVLAVLLLAAGEAVTTAALRDRLWGTGAAPASAVSAIQGHVHHLRKCLDSAGGPRIRTHRAEDTDQVSYALPAGRDAVDSARFRRLVAAGETAQARGDTTSAVRCFDAALTLWRGEPVPELRTSPYAVATRHALAGLRQDAAKRRAGGLLELGAVSRATAELLVLNAQQPGDEGTVLLLADALCRSGGRARALHLLTEEAGRWERDFGLVPAGLRRERERIAGRRDGV
ncbi:BTAD domain-containing putative transcriptional regulator [Streptomyces sp. DSM 44917]|uniref:BTAD domain-containing putative transcriptional regulator n=1 Tax=Streptomyces boetiae TaxID=3075541 RepID=A0ABU2LCK1_9ACTN|nr:BTAD domain-containing putative transcriptional regulator [Streptomyces sp. DSM 44917]MDT0309305.1 BTAD domain-containing putative transcriptional regulator [Streptomyces sp. DSM 44917]